MNREHAQRVYFEQLKRAVPISAVLERYGILSELKRVGSQLKGRCPIHKGSNPKSKQFVVDLDKNIWRCFSPSCDCGGGMLDLVAALENVAIRDAAQAVARWFAIPGGTVINQQSQQRSMTVSTGTKPTHKAYSVEDRAEGEERDAFWTRIGSAFAHKDGRGLNIVLNALPIGNRVVLREWTEDDTKEEDERKAKRKR